VSRLTYLTPSVPIADAVYLHMYVAPEEHEKVYSPTGVRFELSGLRFVISSPRGGIHGGISRMDMPDPVCAREKAALSVPPVPRRFRQEWGTEFFEVQIVLSGPDVSFDPRQVTLVDANGSSYTPARVVEKRDVAQAWVVRFDTPCVPEAAYDLRVGGVTSGGSPVVVPSIHFAPATASSLFGP
jgi:hypothetical protein